jgi:tRNA(adenine34) deaminase
MARAVLTDELDVLYMTKAIELAKRAFKLEEIPIGAVVVSGDGEILGTGYNQTEKRHSQSRHAEIIAIESAGRKVKDWRLDNCTLYVTLQPCFMCMGLVYLSRIARLVYGAESPLFGYDLDKSELPSVYKKHIKGVTSQVLAQESEQMLEEFFLQKRKKGE